MEEQQKDYNSNANSNFHQPRLSAEDDSDGDESSFHGASLGARISYHAGLNLEERDAFKLCFPGLNVKDPNEPAPGGGDNIDHMIHQMRQEMGSVYGDREQDQSSDDVVPYDDDLQSNQSVAGSDIACDPLEPEAGQVPLHKTKDVLDLVHDGAHPLVRVPAGTMGPSDHFDPHKTESMVDLVRNIHQTAEKASSQVLRKIDRSHHSEQDPHKTESMVDLVRNIHQTLGASPTLPTLRSPNLAQDPHKTESMVDLVRNIHQVSDMTGLHHRVLPKAVPQLPSHSRTVKLPEAAHKTESIVDFVRDIRKEAEHVPATLVSQDPHFAIHKTESLVDIPADVHQTEEKLKTERTSRQSTPADHLQSQAAFHHHAAHGQDLEKNQHLVAGSSHIIGDARKMLHPVNEGSGTQGKANDPHHHVFAEGTVHSTPNDAHH
ncbi:hypothetical protein RvY_15838 [Ramazzottius varieornatus]|uniref:Uncharacterized protein n=1 Tax=Ramazzottius varieornatus TaxID=947166 RepID=A0A1D1W0V1_RAMVA|nr:hypothetical protein RvY_15838 [Ramazzottius varieornatus]